MLDVPGSVAVSITTNSYGVLGIDQSRSPSTAITGAGPVAITVAVVDAGGRGVDGTGLCRAWR